MLIIRLPKYHPGLIKEALSICEVINSSPRKGNSIILLNRKSFLFPKLRSNFLFYNLGLLTLAEILLLRVTGGKASLVLHEPSMDNKINYGKKYAIKLHLYELCLTICIFLASHIFVLSSHGRERYEKKYSVFRKPVSQISILPKLTVNYTAGCKEDSILFVGTIHKAKRFDLIYQVISYIALVAPHIRFNFLSRNLDKIKVSMLNKLGNVDVISSPEIKDETIWSAFFLSKILFKLDSNMTQSGLVAQAKISATKVVVTNIPGFSQDVPDRISGSLVLHSDTSKDIANQLIEQIRNYSQDESELNLRAHNYLTKATSDLIASIMLVLD